jgi:hypothetical protein
MGDVVRFKKPGLAERHRGNTLCRNGHHKWELLNKNPFDSKQGKLVTGYRCSRCGATKNQAK